MDVYLSRPNQTQPMPENEKPKFTIFVNNNPIQTDAHELTGSAIKSLAKVPADYELFEVKGDQSVPVGNDQVVHILTSSSTSGPFLLEPLAAMPLPPRLEQELNELRAQHQIEVTEEADLINVVFAGFALGDGWALTHSDLLLRIPRSYADAGPDMFWMNPDVKLAGGQLPQAGEPVVSGLSIEIGAGSRGIAHHLALGIRTSTTCTAILSLSASGCARRNKYEALLRNYSIRRLGRGKSCSVYRRWLRKCGSVLVREIGVRF